MSITFRRMAACVMVIGMLGLAIAGCSTKKDADETTKATTKATTKVTEATTTVDDTVYVVNYYKNWSYLTAKYQDSTTNRYLAWIRDNFGVDIQITERKEDAKIEINLMRAQNDLPDIFVMPDKGILAGLVGDGSIIAMDKYYNDTERYPNLAIIPKEYLGLGSIDGTIYTTFGSYSRDPNVYDGEFGMWFLVQRQLAAELGVPVPSTLTELLAFCEAVKTQKPMSELDVEMFAFGGEARFMVPMMDQIFGLDGFAAYTSGSYIGCLVTSDGKFVPSWATEERKKSLMLLNQMWRSGYMDPEQFAQDGQTKSSKLSTGAYAIMIGSYGEADAFYASGYGKDTEDEKWAWRKEYGPDPIGRINAAGENSISLAYYSPFPRNFGVINADFPSGGADKFMDWVNWKCSEEGMFSDYYEGWPGETWIYDEDTGKAKPWYSWWPNKDPLIDYVEDATPAATTQPDGHYWQVHNHFTFSFNPAYVGLMLEKGGYRKVNIWYEFIYDTTVQFLADPDFSHISTPISLLALSKDADEIYAEMATIYERWWAKVITADTEAGAEKAYNDMISELVGTEVADLSSEVAAEWAKLIADNPAISDIDFPKTATPIADVASIIS